MQKHDDLMNIKLKDDSAAEQSSDQSLNDIVSHLSDYDYYVDSDFWISLFIKYRKV